MVRILPSARRLELDDGGAIVYDKLVSSLASIHLVGLLRPEVPVRIRTHQALMYWLAARDIELLDDDTQFISGDANPFAAGRRVAVTVRRALAQKFRPAAEKLVCGEKLFNPRLVGAGQATATGFCERRVWRRRPLANVALSRPCKI